MTKEKTSASTQDDILYSETVEPSVIGGLFYPRRTRHTVSQASLDDNREERRFILATELLKLEREIVKKDNWGFSCLMGLSALTILCFTAVCISYRPATDWDCSPPLRDAVQLVFLAVSLIAGISTLKMLKDYSLSAQKSGENNITNALGNIKSLFLSSNATSTASRVPAIKHEANPTSMGYGKK